MASVSVHTHINKISSHKPKPPYDMIQLTVRVSRNSESTYILNLDLMIDAVFDNKHLDLMIDAVSNNKHSTFLQCKPEVTHLILT